MRAFFTPLLEFSNFFVIILVSCPLQLKRDYSKFFVNILYKQTLQVKKKISRSNELKKKIDTQPSGYRVLNEIPKHFPGE